MEGADRIFKENLMREQWSLEKKQTCGRGGGSQHGWGPGGVMSPTRAVIIEDAGRSKDIPRAF